ncbi:MAG: thioredoxin family protein, partial [Planctomycetota bacterium]
MKKRITLSLLVLFFGLGLALPLLAEEGSEPKAEEPVWLTDFEKAKTAAAEAKKDLLVSFTGSDWCRPCMMLERTVFSKPEFQDEASKLFVLVNLDFPRRKANPDKEKNEKIRDAYFVTGYPTVLLLDATGGLYGKAGFRPNGAAEYVTHLKSLLEQKGKRAGLLDGLAASEGDAQKSAFGEMAKS